jgi:SAM-dependent methyltransferase
MNCNSSLRKIQRIGRKASARLAAFRQAWRESDDLPHHRCIDIFLSLTRSSLILDSSANKDTSSIDLGCGHRPRNPFKAEQCYGIDIRTVTSADKTVIRKANLAAEPIPFESSSVNFVTAFDFVEHIPRAMMIDGKNRFCFVELMNEIYRVLSTQGIFLSVTPAVPHKSAFTDPTHVNFITSETFPRYFCNNITGFPSAASYGFSGEGFDCIAQGWVGGHLATLLQKP